MMQMMQKTVSKQSPNNLDCLYNTVAIGCSYWSDAAADRAVAEVGCILPLD